MAQGPTPRYFRSVNQPQLPQRPSLTKVQALDLLGSHFGLVGDVDSLPSWRDQNFRVVTDGGDRFVLKIANADEPMALLDLQTDAINHQLDRDLEQVLKGLAEECPPLDEHPFYSPPPAPDPPVPA